MLKKNNLKVNKEDVVEIFFVILYKIALDYMYTHIQTELFGYNGFVNHFDIDRFFLSWTSFAFTYVVIRSKDSNASSILLYTIFFLSICPFGTLYQYDEKCSFWMLASQCLCLMFMKAVFSVGKRTKKYNSLSTRIKGINYRNRSLRTIVGLIVLFFFILSFIRFGIPNIRNLLFEEVYNTRASVNLTTIESLLQNASCRIIIPIALLVLFREKKWIQFMLFALVQVYIYAVTGFKTYLFIPTIIILLQFIPNLNLKKIIVWVLPIAVIVLMSLYFITGNVMLYALFGNRVLFLPSKIKYAYFDFFTQNEFVYFSQSSMAKLLGITSNYSTNIVYLIGATYFNKPNMWTNAGFMADAYADCGFIGMFLMSLLISLVINRLSKELRHVPVDMQKELLAMFLTFYISLNDGGAISVLFSGGLLFAVLVVVFIKFTDDKKMVRKEEVG